MQVAPDSPLNRPFPQPHGPRPQPHCPRPHGPRPHGPRPQPFGPDPQLPGITVLHQGQGPRPEGSDTTFTAPRVYQENTGVNGELNQLGQVLSDFNS